MYLCDKTSLIDGDNYSVTLTDSKNNTLANQEVVFTFGSYSFNATTDENGVAGIVVNNVPANSYNLEVRYSGNDDYQKQTASQKVTVEETRHSETRSIDEILATGEYKKKIGDYNIIEYDYMGDMELALVEDSDGRKWIMGGDGFTSVD